MYYGKSTWLLTRGAASQKAAGESNKSAAEARATQKIARQLQRSLGLSPRDDSPLLLTTIVAVALAGTIARTPSHRGRRTRHPGKARVRTEERRRHHRGRLPVPLLAVWPHRALSRARLHRPRGRRIRAARGGAAGQHHAHEVRTEPGLSEQDRRRRRTPARHRTRDDADGAHSRRRGGAQEP